MHDLKTRTKEAVEEVERGERGCICLEECAQRHNNDKAKRPGCKEVRGATQEKREGRI
jgi:hypothetical protein